MRILNQCDIIIKIINNIIIIGLPEIATFNKNNNSHSINCNNLNELLMNHKNIIIGIYIRMYKKGNN